MRIWKNNGFLLKKTLKRRNTHPSNFFMPHKKIPITLLTGFLGSGKTTLLNHILTAPHGQKIAVIVNEFGDIGIDDWLIKKNTNGIVELVNGCICCSVKNDTLQTMLQLIDEREEVKIFDRIVIETTGLANPIPFVAAFLSKPLLKNYYVLDVVITLVDAAHILMQLDTIPEVRPQIAIANLIVLNKNDLVDSALLDSIESSLRYINPVAKIKRTQQANIDLSEIFSLQQFDAKSQIGRA